MHTVKIGTAFLGRKMDEKSQSQRNSFSKGIAFAKMIDAWRIFPRIFIGVYLFLLYESSMWFMALENPTTEQFGLVSVIIGAGAAWFGLYVNSKGDGKND